MAHILQLSNGTTTVDFLGTSGTSWARLEDGGLLIGTPSFSEEWTGQQNDPSGRRFSGMAYENRSISITFEIVGDDMDDILNFSTKVGKLISNARLSQSIPDRVAAVYLKYQLDTTTNPVYFDVISGYLELPDNIMSVEGLSWYKGSQKSIKGFNAIIVCKPFARGAEVQIVNTASAGIENTSDSKYSNHRTLSTSNLDGDVPGPLRVRYTGRDPGTYSRDEMWVGIRSHYSSNFYHVLEAEYSTYAAYGGSLTSKDTAFSGDTGDSLGGRAVTYAITSSTDQTLMYFSYGVAVSPYNKGRVRVLALGSFSNECRYRLGLRYGATSSVAYYEYRRPETDWHATENYIFDMGTIDPIIYNLDYGEDAWASYLHLTVLPDDSSSKNIRIDALMMMPAEDGKFRKYTFPGDLAATWESIGVDDNAYKNRVRMVEDDGVYMRVGHSLEYIGLPLYVDPGSTSEIFVLAGLSGKFDPTLVSTLNVYYTPLYLYIRGTD